MEKTKAQPVPSPGILEQLLTFVPFLVSILLLVFYAKEHLFAEILYPIGDEAADMLHANQLGENGYLLTGQYSLFSFHHPGPFFFYIAGFFERIFSAIIPTRHGQWVLSILFLNSVFLGISGHLFFNKPSDSNTRKTLKRVVFIILTLLFLETYAISIWPPHKLILPYLAFLTTLPLIAKRKFKYIPLSITLACLLIHGRVDQPLFTLPFILLAYLWGRKANQSSLNISEKKSVFYGLAIGLFFSTPIWIDLILNSPSNLGQITNLISRGPSGNNSWSEATKFILHYWQEPFGIG
ncbi:MAG: hypothetical protein JKY51_04315, partial [Opitutaceae bacterium]|nr:hypothetical protein [Opitutaceae bacterium]